MRYVLLVLQIVAACAPGPGETRCYTNTFGITNCKSGPPVRARSTSYISWWCIQGGSEQCFRGAGKCEVVREKQNSPPCIEKDKAICADDGDGPCFMTAAGCVVVERHQGDDGSECKATRNVEND